MRNIILVILFLTAVCFQELYAQGLPPDSIPPQKKQKGNLKNKVEFKAKFMNDWFYVAHGKEVDTLFNAPKGTEFRRIRLLAKGDLGKKIQYELQLGFSNTTIELKDAYIEFEDVLLFDCLQIGHFKEPISPEYITASDKNSFMERSVLNTFIPGRNAGFQLTKNFLKKHLSLSTGVFLPSDDAGNYQGGNSIFTSRLTGLPVYSKNQTSSTLQAGFSFSHRNMNNDKLSLFTRPESNYAPKFVNLQLDSIDYTQLIGGELIYLIGPLCLQGEMMLCHVHANTLNKDKSDLYRFYAYYGQVSCFITGESRRIKRSNSIVSGINPIRDFGRNRGSGAIEVCLRYSKIDLEDNELRSNINPHFLGQNTPYALILTNIATGVNWYMNSYIRIMAQINFSDLYDVGNTTIYQCRFQLAF
jgi:phosphate-selective porin OprO/OprP